MSSMYFLQGSLFLTQYPSRAEHLYQTPSLARQKETYRFPLDESTGEFRANSGYKPDEVRSSYFWVIADRENIEGPDQPIESAARS